MKDDFARSRCSACNCYHDGISNTIPAAQLQGKYFTLYLVRVGNKNHFEGNFLYTAFPSFQAIFYVHVGCYMTSLGNGYCDDLCNRPEFSYDFGECCLPQINDLSCLECLCHDDGTRHASSM